MSSQCIYCRSVTTGKEGDAHVLPEAIVENDLLLPAGAVCNRCNNYLGRLDSALATHPLISFGIQAFALPGKSGKPRVSLGRIGQSGNTSGQSVSLLPGAVERVTVVGGRPHIVLRTPAQRALMRFHRALHHVAFNLICRVAEPPALLSDSYDSARTYIRSPGRSEVWPYFHSCLGPNPVDIVDIVCLDSPGQVLLRFFNQAFAVDVMRSGTLGDELTRLLPTLEWSEIPP